MRETRPTGQIRMNIPCATWAKNVQIIPHSSFPYIHSITFHKEKSYVLTAPVCYVKHNQTKSSTKLCLFVSFSKTWTEYQHECSTLYDIDHLRLAWQSTNTNITYDGFQSLYPAAASSWHCILSWLPNYCCPRVKEKRKRLSKVTFCGLCFFLLS